MRDIFLPPIAALCLILTLPTIAHTQTPADTAFDLAIAAQNAGRHEDAIQHFEATLVALEREGRAVTPDAGLVTAQLAESLLAIGDPGADRAFDRALSLLKPASNPNPYLTLADRLANMRLAAGRKGEAATLAEGMLARALQSGVPEPILAAVIDAAALIFRHAEHHEKADATIEKALQLTGTDPHASSLRGLARVFRARAAQREGRYADMEKEISLGLVDLERSGPTGAESMAALLLLRAELRYSEGRYKAALGETEEAHRRIAEAKTLHNAWTEATSLRIRLLERLDRMTEARALADEMVATLEKRLGAQDENTTNARLGRVEILIRGLHYDEARAELAALEPLIAALADPNLSAVHEMRVADLALADNDVVAALAAAERAYRLLVGAFPHSPKAIVEPLRLRAEATNSSTDVEFAELAHRELIELSEQAHGTKHPEYAADLSAFALWLGSRHRQAEAEALNRRVVDLIEASYGPDSAKFAGALTNLAVSIVADQSRTAESVPLYERAIAIVDKLGDLPRELAFMRFNLAGALALLGRYQEALDLNRKARESVTSLPPSSGKKIFVFEAGEMQALAALGRIDEALEVGIRMANTASIETAEDLQNFVLGLTLLSQIATHAGDAKLGIAVSRRAMDETARLGHDAGSAYRLSAATLIGSAWALSNP